jgi:putative ABC transport system substrate-binding protein
MRVTPIGLLGLFVLTGLLVGPLATGAQRPGKSPRIGILHLGAAADSLTEAFEQGLHDLGYVEGKNLVLEYRFAAGQFERLPALAAELVRLQASRQDAHRRRLPGTILAHSG